MLVLVIEIGAVSVLRALVDQMPSHVSLADETTIYIRAYIKHDNIVRIVTKNLDFWTYSHSSWGVLIFVNI